MCLHFVKIVWITYIQRSATLFLHSCFIHFFNFLIETSYWFWSTLLLFTASTYVCPLSLNKGSTNTLLQMCVRYNTQSPIFKTILYTPQFKLSAKPLIFTAMYSTRHEQMWTTTSPEFLSRNNICIVTHIQGKVHQNI